MHSWPFSLKENGAAINPPLHSNREIALMGMAAMVMPMRVRPNRLQLRRRAAPMGSLATRRFKLNRRMRDTKAVAQSAVDAIKNAAALRHRHLRDRDMARKSIPLR